MFEIIEEVDGFYVVDDKGKKLNTEPFPSEKEAEAFKRELVGDKEKLPLPPKEDMPVPSPTKVPLPLPGMPGMGGGGAVPGMGGGMPPMPPMGGKGLPF
jgi:hypothetical protein